MKAVTQKSYTLHESTDINHKESRVKDRTLAVAMGRGVGSGKEQPQRVTQNLSGLMNVSVCHSGGGGVGMPNFQESSRHCKWMQFVVGEAQAGEVGKIKQNPRGRWHAAQG